MAFKIGGFDGNQAAGPEGRRRVARADHGGRSGNPEDYMGDVMGDLNRRRGMILGMDDTVSGKVIRAEVPLGEMFGYATDVRSMSQVAQVTPWNSKIQSASSVKTSSNL